MPPTTGTATSGATFAPGATTVTCTVRGAAGTTAAKSFAVRVTYAWSSVLQPINADNSSLFKLGSTVPMKFQFIGASASITNLVAKLTYAKVSDGITGTYLEALSTAADSGNTFRYDAASGQYIFNLATKGLTSGTYRLKIDLGDGMVHSVDISLK